MTHVFNLSGGKSSAYMTILERPTPDDIVLFTDTGRKHPATQHLLAIARQQRGRFDLTEAQPAFTCHCN